MTGVRVEISETALGQANAALARAARALDFRPAFEGPVDQYVRAWIAQVFETAGAKNGTPWAPLRPLTLLLKARANRAGFGTLRFTDRLYRSYTIRSSPQGLLQITPTSYLKGTRVPYGTFHALGWTSRTVFGRPRRRAVRVPARPIFPPEGPPTAFTAGVTNILRAHLARGFGA